MEMERRVGLVELLDVFGIRVRLDVGGGAPPAAVLRLFDQQSAIGFGEDTQVEDLLGVLA